MNSRRSPIPTYGTTTIQDYPGDYPNNEFRMDYQQQQHYQYPPLQMNYLEPHHHQHHPNDHLMSLGTPQEERTLFDFQFQNLHDVLPQDMMNLVPNPSPPFSPNFHSYFDHHPHNLNFIATQPMGLSLNVDPITQDTSSQPPQPPSHHHQTGPNNNRIMSLPDISLTESDPIKINVPASHKKSKLSLNSKSKSTKSRIRRASSRPESNINKSDPTTDLDSEPKGEPRQYECHIPGCTKIFKRSEHLKRHVRSIHSTEKPFPCPTCGKHFSRSDNLNQHLRIHARPKTKISTIRARPTQPYPMDFDHLLPFLPYYSPQHQDPTTLPTFPSPYPTSIVNEEGNGFPATTFSPYLPSPSQS